jgi:hypothetical protein
VLLDWFAGSMYRERLEDMIHKYNVDLVIGAHLHSYERVRQHQITSTLRRVLTTITTACVETVDLSGL